MTSRLAAVARKAGLRRARVAAARARMERGLLAAVPRRRHAATGRVLCYHGVGTPDWGINDMTPARFREQLEQARSWGFRFVPASRLAAGEGSPHDLAITFDDGLLSVAKHAAPILSELDIPWTLFVVADWADGNHRFGQGVFMQWGDIQRLADTGVEIGSHSMSHPNFGRIAAAEARRELRESRRTIDHRIGIQTDSFAIPMGQSTDWSACARMEAAAAGYRYVYAQSGDRRPEGTVSRTFIARSDATRVFKAALEGAFDQWEEWV